MSYELIAVLMFSSMMLMLLTGQRVGQLWLAGVIPGLILALLFCIYIAIRCRLSPHLGPALTGAERELPLGEKLRLIKAGLLPLLIFVSMMVPFLNGWTSLVESSALGAVCAFAVAVIRGRMTLVVFEESVRKSLRITCMFIWIILTALASGAVFDGRGGAGRSKICLLARWV